jgi:glycosyltransferase 2 family protein
MSKSFTTEAPPVPPPVKQADSLSAAPTKEEIYSPLWWKITKVVLILAIFALLGYFFFRDFSKLSVQTLDIRPGYFIISAFLLLFGLLLEVWVWQKNLQMVGGNISLKNSFKLYYLANLTRYLPGKIWSVLGFMKVGQSAHLPPVTTFIGLATGLVSSLVSALLLGALLLLLSRAQLPHFSLWAIALVLLFSIWLLHPVSANLAFRLTGKMIKRPLPQLNYTFRQIIFLVGLYALAWVVFSCSFAFLVKSFAALTQLQFVYALGVFPLAYALGYLAIFSPGGWGVREGGLTLLLSLTLPTYLAVAVALASRLMFTVVEVIFFGIALKLKWEKN